jgi:hypothetical protein
MTQQYLLSILGDIAIWGGATVPIIFAIFYTLLSKWWKNAIGRSIIGLDAALWLVFAPLAVTLAWPTWTFTHTLPYTWIVTVAILAVPVIAAYRIVALAKLWSMRRKLNHNGIEHLE